MIDDLRISRANILIQQRRYDEAEKVLKESLAQDTNNVQLMSMLAEVYLQQDRYDVALSVVNQAIGMSPDTALLFYMKARIVLQQENYKDAEAFARQAVALEPIDADYHALLANIQLVRKNYAAALEIANKALELDAENLLALNTRSTALLKLDKAEESFSTIEGALREDPNNPYTHANYGWGLLEKGNHKKALEHFKESLKGDPNFEYARAGMLEAIKATNPLYRLFLKYAFFMGNLTAKYQWGVLLGFYFGVRFLKTIARTSDTLRPFLVPVVIFLSLVAFSTWVIGPIADLFLRFNRYGKFLLDEQKKMSSNFVAVSLALSLIGVLLYFALGDQRFLAVAVFGFAMMLPLGTMLSPAKNKYVLVIYAAVLALAGLYAIGLTFSTGELFNFMTPVFILGFVAFQWVANYFLIRDNNR